MNRRQAIKKSALLFGVVAGMDDNHSLKSSYQLGACDWSLGKTLSPEAFDVAKKIGLQGVQVSYNTGKDPGGLSDPKTLELIRDASKNSGVKISSLAIGELNRVPYKSDARTEEWVWNSVDAAKELGARVILLAFFSEGDLRNDTAGQKMVIERLKKVAPHAEKAGITLGIESYLTAEEHLNIIEQVGSKSVQVYYDFRNATDAGNDVFKELKILGKDRICELHMKENGQRLGEGTLNWPDIAKAVKDIGYEGWMQIEWASPKGVDIVACYRHNRAYLNRLFQF
ncbi:sugar phosphate isomerase/epimerase family protein [Dyadobacter sp. LHD-138]|uniref:sugar phosphate isomerase/epimerase family protein n=1 Tax=Dyadobacter sp. LHD-138 TaxID=3071413 RepID=UPI0027E205BC|nr:sugar phosphate isomerase/epimerase family protein [Dyadobacter sp. LHD-138]MDQ6481715.1 sugar phosphate isomerase/epimerase family protein [Dyadobacter sp. LHD-138]